MCGRFKSYVAFDTVTLHSCHQGVVIGWLTDTTQVNGIQRRGLVMDWCGRCFAVYVEDLRSTDRVTTDEFHSDNPGGSRCFPIFDGLEAGRDKWWLAEFLL